LGFWDLGYFRHVPRFFLREISQRLSYQPFTDLDFTFFEDNIMKTYHTPVKEIERKWFVVNAEDKVLGRLASEIATRLRGKHKPNFSPHMDVGDFVVVVNADKVKLTGNKLDGKVYYRHSGYIGGITEMTAKEVLEKKPTDLLKMAVRGMLSKNTLGRKQLKKLKIYTGNEHPHAAQQPEMLEI
jgi:large subunit ribosomal protein L13